MLRKVKYSLYLIPPLLLFTLFLCGWYLLHLKENEATFALSPQDETELVHFIQETLLAENDIHSVPSLFSQTDLFMLTVYHPGDEPHYFYLVPPWTQVRFEHFFRRIKKVLPSVLMEAEGAGQWFLKIEVKTSPYRFYPLYHPSLLLYHIDWGREGIMLKKEHTEQLIFPTQVIDKGLKPEQYYDTIFRPELDQNTELFRFTTDALLLDVVGQEYYRVRRNQPTRTSLSRELVLNRIRTGADFLIRLQSQNGRYCYDYDPVNDRVLPGYNILRHSGTTFALFQVYNLTGDSRYYEAAERALTWLIRNHLRHEKEISYILDRDLVKLGGVALTLLAITEREAAVHDGRDEELMERLGNFILHNMKEDGELLSYYQWSPTLPVPDRISIYYPGEATFSLVRLYRVTGDLKWQTAAIKATDYLIERSTVGGVPLLVFPDAWLLYALSELYEDTGYERFLDYACKIGTIIMASQYQLGDNDLDYVGASLDYLFPRSTPAGARAEGLGALCHALARRGLKEKLTHYLPALLLSAQFQLTQQVTGKNMFYMKNPQKAEGGFFGSTLDTSMRIDYTQHNLSALLSTLEFLP